MKVYRHIDELIDKTPLIELTNIKKQYNLKAKIFAKVEFFNPGGSVKDRIALAMINDLEEPKEKKMRVKISSLFSLIQERDIYLPRYF